VISYCSFYVGQNFLSQANIAFSFYYQRKGITIFIEKKGKSLKIKKKASF